MSDTLSNPVLILNKGWSPIGISSISNILKKILNDKADIVHPETYQLFSWQEWIELSPAEDQAYISSPSIKVIAPEIARVHGISKIPRSYVNFSRVNLFKRDNFTCQYCNKKIKYSDRTIDHVVPRAQGGTSKWSNCVLACRDCNYKKADRTPDQARMPLIKEPKKPVWLPDYSIGSRSIESWNVFVKKQI